VTSVSRAGALEQASAILVTGAQIERR